MNGQHMMGRMPPYNYHHGINHEKDLHVQDTTSNEEFEREINANINIGSNPHNVPYVTN